MDISDGCARLFWILCLVSVLDFKILFVSDGRGHAGPVDFATRLGSPMMSLGMPVAVAELLRLQLLLLWYKPMNDDRFSVACVLCIALCDVTESGSYVLLKSHRSDYATCCNSVGASTLTS